MVKLRTTIEGNTEVTRRGSSTTTAAQSIGHGLAPTVRGHGQIDIRPTKSILILWTLVLLVPATCVLIAGSIVSLIRHRTPLLFVEPTTFLFQCMSAGSPFFLLAFISSVWALWKSTTEHWRTTRIAAYRGVVATMFFWAIYYIDPFISQGDGPSFAVALLKFLSPFIVAIVMLIAIMTVWTTDDMPA